MTYCGDHFIIHRNINSICCTPRNNIMFVGQLYGKKKKLKKQTRSPEGEVGERQLDKGDQNV